MKITKSGTYATHNGKTVKLRTNNNCSLYKWKSEEGRTYTQEGHILHGHATPDNLSHEVIVKSETPFRVTGEGRYRQRDGSVVDVTKSISTVYPWKSPDGSTYQNNGREFDWTTGRDDLVELVSLYTSEPKFAITTTGLYKTLDGDKVKIGGNTNGVNYTWYGIINGSNNTWRDDGRIGLDHNHPKDIVSVWTDTKEKPIAPPKPVKKSESYGIKAPGPHENFATIDFNFITGRFQTRDGMYINGNGQVKHAFANDKTAAAYAEAFNVLFLELPLQPGVIKAGEVRYAYLINGEGVVRPSVGKDDHYAPATPIYESESAALNALHAVGRDRVMKALKTLKGEF